jgi:trehalose-6-phosphate synthase
MWTRSSLCDLVHEKLHDYRFMVVSNREPYIHTLVGDQIKCTVPASGLTVALDPVMQACGGTWVAHGSGNADARVCDASGRVSVPPDDPSYSLRRVWLSAEEERGYYYGMANEALWPLCHIVYKRPVFLEADWKHYRAVNEKFARTVVEEAAGRPTFVFIQDYHLSLLAKIIKSLTNNIITAQFWHIPWPNPEAFRICPWQNEILEGLLANDIMGFHIRYHCNNFIETVARALEVRVDHERSEIVYNDHKTAIRPFPISVDFEHFSVGAQSKETEAEMAKVKASLGLKDKVVGLGIERFDYTKGIAERFIALDRFLERNPRYRGKLVFIQAGVSSRSQIEAYKALDRELVNMVRAINFKYCEGDWQPIILLHDNLPQLTLLALRRLADFCIVSSLHDGMNLVAKEYAASRYDEKGVLILSQFTGSARELSDAVQVNPYAADHFAEAIKMAVEMPLEEQARRMRKMRQVVQENNIYKWAADVIAELSRYEFGG